MREIVLRRDTANNRYLKPIRTQSTLVEVSNRFTSLSRPSSKDVALFREQFYTLVLNTDTIERKQIAQILSRSEYAPKAIIIFFAMEEIAIASAPLLFSPALQPSDLNQIIGKCSLEHAKAIARRANLETSNVVGLLGLDNEAMQIKAILKDNLSLVNNDEIINILNSKEALEAWIEKPADVITNQPVNIPKPSISVGSKDLSSSLLKLANKGRTVRQKPAGKPVKATFKDISLDQIEKQLLATARYNDLEAFATSIQYFCGLPHQTTTGFMHRQNAGLLATLLRALDVSEVTAARIMLMMNRDIGRNAQVFKVVMKKYRNLSQEECISFFTKNGATFSRSEASANKDPSATRYALSLAARERRAALQEQEYSGTMSQNEEKLRA